MLSITWATAYDKFTHDRSALDTPDFSLLQVLFIARMMSSVKPVHIAGQHGGYNLCHFWSNFEIGDLRFFRSEAYQEFFSYLDRSIIYRLPQALTVAA